MPAAKRPASCFFIQKTLGMFATFPRETFKALLHKTSSEHMLPRLQNSNVVFTSKSLTPGLPNLPCNHVYVHIALPPACHVGHGFYPKSDPECECVGGLLKCNPECGCLMFGPLCLGLTRVLESQTDHKLENSQIPGLGTLSRLRGYFSAAGPA